MAKNEKGSRKDAAASAKTNGKSAGAAAARGDSNGHVAAGHGGGGGSNKKKAVTAAPVPPQQQQHHTGLSTRGIVFMVLLAIQYGQHSLLAHTFIRPGVISSSLVIVQEAIKFVMALVMLTLEGTSVQDALRGWTWQSSILCAALPACIFSLQNWLIFTSHQHLDGLTFNLINQSKIIWTALFVFLFVRQRQSKMQLVALALIFITAVILSFRDEPETATKRHNDFYLGVVPNLAASLCSGVAAGLAQYALQHKQRNSYIFTMELCVFSLASMFLSLLLSNDGHRIRVDGFFDKWSVSTVIPVINNAAGGIFTGMVVKYAGGVQKGFSIIFALMITAVLQWLVLSAPLNLNLIIALPMGLLGLWLHTTFPYRAKLK